MSTFPFSKVLGTLLPHNALVPKRYRLTSKDLCFERQVRASTALSRSLLRIFKPLLVANRKQNSTVRHNGNLRCSNQRIFFCFTPSAPPPCSCGTRGRKLWYVPHADEGRHGLGQSLGCTCTTSDEIAARGDPVFHPYFFISLCHQAKY